MKPKTRLEYWKTPKFIPIMYTGDSIESDINIKTVMDTLENKRKEYYKKNNIDEENIELSSHVIMQSAREIVFDVVDGKPLFHIICQTLSVERGELEIGHTLDLIIDGKSDDEIYQEVLFTLAQAHLLDVPILPNSNKLESELTKYYKKLLVDGFSLKNEEGELKSYKLVKSPGAKIENINFFRKYNLVILFNMLNY